MDRWSGKTTKPGFEGDSADEINKTVSEFQLLQSILAGDGSDHEMTEVSFGLPLPTVLELIPKKYLARRVLTDAENAKIARVTVEDLYEQLRRGKVAVSVSDLCFGVPADIVMAEALQDNETMVTLPLPAVVRAIDPALLKKRTAQKGRAYDMAGLPDPFKVEGAVLRSGGTAPAPVAPVAAPAAAQKKEEPHRAVPPADAPAAPFAASPRVAAEVPAAAEPVSAPPSKSEPAVAAPAPAPVFPAEAPPEPAAPEVPVAAPPVAAPTVRRRPAPVPEGPEEDIEMPERWGGVNLNTATEAQLLTLKGVARMAAKSIVDYRNEHGLFKSVFDLYDVPRIGRKTFKRITGMPYGVKRHHRRHRLARLLGVPAKEISSLKDIVGLLTSKAGTGACVLSDGEGMLMAQSGADEFAAPLSAVAPRMLLQVRDNMRQVTAERVDHASICSGDRMFTVVACGSVFLTGVHKTDVLNRRGLRLILKVTREVEWLLSHRGYVSPVGAGSG